jgi:tRNA threonylcarbamoyl adenosine modification protein YeaZ
MILAINTASEQISIALYKKDQIEIERAWESYRTQSKELLPAIESMLKENNVKLTDLTTIVVFQGPGSYTGLRVGISVANALAWSLDIPIIGFTNRKSKPEKEFSALNIAKKVLPVVELKGHTYQRKIIEPYYKNNSLSRINRKNMLSFN